MFKPFFQVVFAAAILAVLATSGWFFETLSVPPTAEEQLQDLEEAIDFSNTQIDRTITRGEQLVSDKYDLLAELPKRQAAVREAAERREGFEHLVTGQPGDFTGAAKPAGRWEVAGRPLWNDSRGCIFYDPSRKVLMGPTGNLWEARRGYLSPEEVAWADPTVYERWLEMSKAARKDTVLFVR